MACLEGEVIFSLTAIQLIMNFSVCLWDNFSHISLLEGKQMLKIKVKLGRNDFQLCDSLLQVCTP